MASIALTARQKAAVLVVTVFATLFAAQASTRPASAGYASNVGYIQLGNDYFVNFDFYSQSYSNSNVDWQMQYIHFGRANQDRLERYVLGGRYWQDATAQFGNKYAYINDNGSGWRWEGGDGKATSVPGCGTDRYHYRPYAPGDYAFYDPTSSGWGYWLPTSTHRDINDGCGGRSGWSETVEDDISNYLKAQVCGPYKVNCGYANDIYQDYLYVGGAISGYDSIQGSNHYWSTDGRATVFRW